MDVVGYLVIYLASSLAATVVLAAAVCALAPLPLRLWLPASSRPAKWVCAGLIALIQLAWLELRGDSIWNEAHQMRFSPAFADLLLLSSWLCLGVSLLVFQGLRQGSGCARDHRPRNSG